MTSPRAPAIVVRMDLNGLGVVRSLAKGKVPVIAVDRSFEKKSTGKLRFAKRVPFSSLQGPEFINELSRLACASLATNTARQRRPRRIGWSRRRMMMVVGGSIRYPSSCRARKPTRRTSPGGCWRRPLLALDATYGEAALRNNDWAKTCQHDNGWFAIFCLTMFPPGHPCAGLCSTRYSGSL